jgi:hypothetical protein
LNAYAIDIHSISYGGVELLHFADTNRKKTFAGEVRRLLALLVQKYKYWHRRICVQAAMRAHHLPPDPHVLSLLALLVQKYKY